MKRAVISSLAVFALLASAPALAQSVKKNVILEAGGLTIGGPSVIKNLAAGSSVPVLVATEAVDACTTIVNVGKAGGQINVTAGGVASTAVQAGESRVFCRASATLIEFQCFSSGAACSVLWRVDRL